MPGQAPASMQGAVNHVDGLSALAEVGTLDDFLYLLLQEIAATGYRFITPTPLTHARVLANRKAGVARNLRDVFGWNLPVEAQGIDANIVLVMKKSGVLHESGALWRSGVRISTLGDDLFLHSAFPTAQEAAVFFGPDTYRFVRFIASAMPELLGSFKDRSAGKTLRILDIGCGSGAGGIAAARLVHNAGMTAMVTMNDINPQALQFAAINARAADVPIEVAEGDVMSTVSGEFDLIICNPPYLQDDAQRAYRHGGERLGRELGVRMASHALRLLSPHGRLLFYTGVAIVDGTDHFASEIQELLAAADCQGRYSEIDPDVFGEELERPVYAHADRIAAVGLVAFRTARPEC